MLRSLLVGWWLFYCCCFVVAVDFVVDVSAVGWRRSRNVLKNNPKQKSIVKMFAVYLKLASGKPTKNQKESQGESDNNIRIQERALIILLGCGTS